MISKSNKQAGWVWFEITSMISVQNCTPEVELPLNYIYFEVLKDFSHWLSKRCDLEQNKWNLWINLTAESQSDWRDNQWFQNGFNNINIKNTLYIKIYKKYIASYLIQYPSVGYVGCC